jgi:hypothetical protein
VAVRRVWSPLIGIVDAALFHRLPPAPRKLNRCRMT